MKDFFNALYVLAIDMGFYMVIGLLLVTLFNVLIKKEWISKQLGSGSLWSIIKASILGVPLPLCSCGVVPTGMYLKEQGASDASTASFLISTPQTGVDSIAATYGLMGITFAWFRPVAAFISGIIGGIMVKWFGKTKSLPTQENAAVCEDGNCAPPVDKTKLPFNVRLKNSFIYAFGDFVGDIAYHFIVGLIVAALITVLIPADFLVSIGLDSGILAMLVMIIVGAPMYICSTSSIPIALSLIAKGLSPGTAFVFLFMGPFTNVATISILGKKLGSRTTIIYLVSAAISAIGFGYLLDFLIGNLNLPFVASMGNYAHTENIAWYKIVLGVAFTALIIFHVGRNIFASVKSARAKRQTKGDYLVFNIKGMTCDGCSGAIKTALLNTKGVKNAEVSLEEKSAKVWGDFDAQAIIDIIEKKGYTVVGQTKPS